MALIKTNKQKVIIELTQQQYAQFKIKVTGSVHIIQFYVNEKGNINSIEHLNKRIKKNLNK